MTSAPSGYWTAMAADTQDWTVPAPLRAMLWWPGVSFVLVLLVPDAATWSIAVAGLALATTGAVVVGLRRRLGLTRSDSEPTSAAVARVG